MNAMSKKRVFGIDLGTTYSCIARVVDGKPEVIENLEHTSTTPSVVHFEDASSIKVGQAAKEMATIYPDDVIQLVKRHMGDASYSRTFHGKSYQPQAISSFILKKLAEDAEKVCGEKVEDVVITCPAYFGNVEKAATREAGILAGLNVRLVATEPNAAAFAHGLEGHEGQVVLVYDLGGGTFDVTLLRMPGTMIATDGDHGLGGADWDKVLVGLFCQQIQQSTGVDLKEIHEFDEGRFYQELVNLAEKCKFTLTSSDIFRKPVRFNAEVVKIEITRQEFDARTSHLLDRTVELTRDMLSQPSAVGVEISHVLLVGGSTFMPQVEARLKKEFPSFEFLRNDPNQIVAKGAALIGFKYEAQDDLDRMMAGGASRDEATKTIAHESGLPSKSLERILETEFRVSSARSFGLVIMNSVGSEVVRNLVTIGDQMPLKVTRRFSTYGDQQRSVLLRVIENNSQVGEEGEIPVSDGEKIGEVEVEFQRALPKDSPLEVTYNLSLDGILAIHGRDLTTNGTAEANFVSKALNSEQALLAKRDELRALRVG